MISPQEPNLNECSASRQTVIKPKKNRRRLSVTLRGLLITFTILSTILAGLANRYREWHRLETGLNGLGAFVAVKYVPLLPDFESPVLSMIDEVLWPPTVLEVTFHGDWSPPPESRLAIWSYSWPICQNIDDDKLKVLVGLLSSLKRCPKISLIGTDVTDQGLLELQRLQSVQELNFTGANISQRGLRNLQGLQLKSLNLSYTRISDNDIWVLATFRRLESLDVSMSNVTEDGANRLRTLLPICTILWRG